MEKTSAKDGAVAGWGGRRVCEYLWWERTRVIFIPDETSAAFHLTVSQSFSSRPACVLPRKSLKNNPQMFPMSAPNVVRMLSVATQRSCKGILEMFGAAMQMQTILLWVPSCQAAESRTSVSGKSSKTWAPMHLVTPHEFFMPLHSINV